MGTRWLVWLAMAAAGVVLVLDAVGRDSAVVSLVEYAAAGLLLGAVAASTPRRQQADHLPTAVSREWRLPQIHGDRGGLLRLLSADDLASRIGGEVELIVPLRLRVLARGLARGSGFTDRGSAVLIDGRPGEAALVTEAAAAVGAMPLLRVRLELLVSDDPAFSARAMSTIVRNAARHTPCVVHLDGLDRIAQRDTAVPPHQARRATNDVVSALRWAGTVPGLLVVASSASMATLDRSITDGHFQHVVSVGDRRRGPGRPHLPAAGAA